jgi:SAM-dependent methyltransferase
MGKDKQKLIDSVIYPETMQYVLDGLVPTGCLIDRMKVFNDVCPQFFTSGNSLLDIGCSKGFFSLLAANNGFKRVVGIDPNSKVIDLCNELKTDNMEFVVDSFRDFKINGLYDRIFIGNGPHYLFADCSGTWDWIYKLAILSTDLVLLEGGFDMSDPQMESLIKPKLVCNFSLDKFINVANKFFTIEKITKSCINGRYVILLKKKDMSISNYVDIRYMPIVHVFRLGGNIHSTLFLSIYDDEVTFCKIYPDHFPIFCVWIASLSPNSTNIISMIKHYDKFIGWHEKLITSRKCCNNDDFIELLKVKCKHQIFLSRNGYIDIDIALANGMWDGDKIKIVDKNQVYHIKDFSPVHHTTWLNYLMDSGLPLYEEDINSIYEAFLSKDSHRIESTFSMILRELEEN